MSRRTNGEGNIRKRPDGRWEASVMLDGRRYWASAPTQQLAKAKLDETRLRFRAGVLVAPKSLSLGAFLDQWLDSGRGDWKPKTHVGYASLVDNYWRPTLGHVRLQRLTPAMIAAAYGLWRDERKVSGGTLLNVHRCLHRALRVAVLWGHLGSNPADRVEAPKARRRRPDLWTVARLHSFIAGLPQDDDWTALWLLLIGSGCRIGEALALRWSDVDLEAGSVHIRQSASWVKGERLILTPKTMAGSRTVSLPAQSVSSLRRWNERQADRRIKLASSWEAGEHVFTTWAGELPSLDHVRAALTLACNRATVPTMRVHDLRHLSASLLLERGVALPAVSRRLGHANVAVTATVYAHALSNDEAIGDILAEVLKGCGEPE